MTMAKFTTLQTVTFLQTSPDSVAQFFQTRLAAGGQLASKALGCPRAGDLNWHLDQADADTGFVVFVPSAADALRLAAPGVAPRATLAQWSEELRSLFQVATRHRARILLLGLVPAAQSPAAAMAAISTSFDLGLPALAAQEPVTLDIPQDAIARLGAHVLAAEDATVRRLEARLQAKAAALPAVTPRIDNLLADVTRLLAEIESRIVEKNGLIADRDQRLAEFSQQLAERGEALDGARAEVAALANHIEQIRTSTSWRLTGPLRRFRRLFPRR